MQCPVSEHYRTFDRSGNTYLPTLGVLLPDLSDCYLRYIAISNWAKQYRQGRAFLFLLTLFFVNKQCSVYDTLSLSSKLERLPNRTEIRKVSYSNKATATATVREVT